ncbi:MAG TPA: thiamine pyrophosphate-dependent dehydrogenase E1 component subunit alpha [Thermoanaerobaculaceae bacterium]|nr:thiamine pyrophosphate-dependent dehydrogenase E1 component subunit alpha [Thermoanaerobaculaceae bacterium]HQU33027.1 thiamine pyrophosphate-dependent dehydrogenase E1 component subunit alpha [Thermoanaerobaculaceae bacterium]
MPPDLWSLYALMLRSRLFEEAVAQLWKGGFISGEMHLGTGEEAVVAGVVAQLGSEDAMALDHRGTAALLMRGADPVLILKELLGLPDGLCGGIGGHMHLLSKRHLAAASGIVGAAAPAAVGFALAAEHLRPGTVAVAFFGEGAMNQGMLMESLNLAAAWNLPVVFVCKDDRWSITTQSDTVTAGNLEGRARGLGVPAVAVDGGEVTKVWEAASDALDRARVGGGPTFLHARCVHLEGHFLGFQMIRLLREPLREAPKIAIPLAGSFLRRGGAPARERVAGLMAVISSVLATMRDPRREPSGDPIRKARTRLRSDLARLRALEDEAEREVKAVVAAAMAAEAAS